MSDAHIYRREAEWLKGLAALVQNIIRQQEYLYMASEYERLALEAERANNPNRQETGG